MSDILALLIDGENIPASHYKQIMANLTGKGEICVARIFGDFSVGPHSSWIDLGREAGFGLIFQPSGGKGKNSTDIAMTIDAMDLLHQGQIDRICLVSTDRDFAPLVRRLKEGGLRVTGMGLANAGVAYKSSCHDFHVLGPAALTARKPSSPVQKTPIQAKPVAPAKQAITAEEIDDLQMLLVAACEEHGAAGWMPLPKLGSYLARNGQALAQKIGGKGLLKRLQALEIITTRGSGSELLISPRQRAGVASEAPVPKRATQAR